jgi:drug/metabolite transporter (DMT)-like permease
MGTWEPKCGERFRCAGAGTGVRSTEMTLEPTLLTSKSARAAVRGRDRAGERAVRAAFVMEAVLAGGNGVAMRFSNRELDPLWGAGLRFALAAGLLWVLMAACRLALPRGRALVGALLFGLINFSGAYALGYLALVDLHAGFGQILLALVPLATLLLAVLWRQEHLGTAAVGGTLVALVGVAVMSRAPFQDSPPGLSLLAALGSVLCFAQAAVLVRRFPPVHPITMNAVAMAAGAGLLIAGSVVAGESLELPRHAETWGAIAYLVAVGSIAVFLLYLFVLGHWPASRAAYGFVLIPFATVLLSAWLDDEPVDGTLALGGLLVLAGVYVGALRPGRRPRRPHIPLNRARRIMMQPKSSLRQPDAHRRQVRSTAGRSRWIVAVLAVAAGSAAAAPGALAADAVTEWNVIARRAVVTACMAPRGNPLHETRMYATAHVAVHDALNAIERRSRPYALELPRPLPSASPEVAVATAARDVLVSHLGQLPEPFATCGGQAAIALVQARYEQALAAVPEGSAKVQGVRLGRAAAETALALREGDGSDTPILDPGYPQGTRPGEYRFTPDGAQYALGPGWGRVRLFVLEHPAQFASPPPLPLTSRAYAADFEEVKRLGGNGTTTPSTRTEDQSQIARFWIESSPQAWNRIALAATETRGSDPWANARLFALLNLALADGYIANFHEKYDRHPTWRPITAIRLADQDGNPLTVADPTWTALGPAPPIPEHESGHSLQGGAAAQVLHRLLGSVRFRTCSATLPAGQTCDAPGAVQRSYTSFFHAARENALSRIYVGWHFRYATEVGLRRGRRIGQYVVRHALTPVRCAPTASGARRTAVRGAAPPG